MRKSTEARNLRQSFSFSFAFVTVAISRFNMNSVFHSSQIKELDFWNSYISEDLGCIIPHAGKVVPVFWQNQLPFKQIALTHLNGEGGLYMSCCFPPTGIQMNPNQQPQADPGVHSLFQNHVGREAFGGSWVGPPWPKLATWESSQVCQQLHNPSSGRWVGWMNNCFRESLL